MTPSDTDHRSVFFKHESEEFPPTVDGNMYRNPQQDIVQSVKDLETFCPK